MTSSVGLGEKPAVRGRKSGLHPEAFWGASATAGWHAHFQESIPKGGPVMVQVSVLWIFSASSLLSV